MKLSYSPGACSLAAHIVAREASLAFELIRVDLATHTTEAGEDYLGINPRGQVPTLVIDGEAHTEVAALIQYLAEQAPETGLAPPAGTLDRFRVNQWLTFITAELHKTISPWLFRSDTAASTRQAALARLATRFAELDVLLGTRPYLTGEVFTIADAYAFAIVNWANFIDVDLGPYPHLSAFMARVAARPKVREALRAEQLLSAAA